MKNSIYIFLFFSLFYTCEDVVEVDLNNAEPRLVIEASINWFKNTAGNEQSIKLSLSSPFFDESTPPANGATIQITDTNGNIFNFIEDNNTGIYRNNDFIPVLNDEYFLTINYNEETYTASETLKSVVPIDYVEQINDGGFSGEDIEIKTFFTDPANVNNYYFFEYTSDIPVIPNLDVLDDEFIDGNQIFAYYTEENLESGDEVIMRHFGVSKQYYEFMFILLQQGSSGGGPFGTQPATVRGNCINTTEPDNYPFGYFRLSEAEELVYIVE